MKPAELIDEARDFHPSFSPNKHGATLCMRELARAQKRFYSRVVAGGAEVAVAQDVVFTADDIAEALEGTPLNVPSYLKIVAALVAADEGIYAMGFDQHEAWNMRQSGDFVARLSGRKLYLMQPEEFMDAMTDAMKVDLPAISPWTNAQAIRLSIVPLPGDLTDLDKDMVAPDEAKLYLVAALVEFMARRSPEMPGQDRREMIQKAQTDQDDVIQQYLLRNSNETSWQVTPEE